MTRHFVLPCSIVTLLVVAGACADRAARQPGHEPVVDELIALLERRADLRDRLVRAIETAKVREVDSLDAFYAYVDDLVTWIPVERESTPKVLRLHYVINQAADNALNKDEAFSAWMHGMANAWGTFLDSPASAAGIQSFASLPDYKVDDYITGPSGWQTFNQFFAREIRPGKRPIADPADDAVIVSPADCVFMGSWPIDDGSTITVKGAEWGIPSLLDASPYADAFKNGTYAHCFLRVTDYHRYHMPVGGVIKEVRNVHGRVYLDVVRKDDGTLSAVNGDTYQFNQERGIVVVDSPKVGLVAVVPVGMTVISSVNLTPEVGTELRKGEQFGYFLFGGSDMVLLFQNRGVVLEAEPGKKYLQGERIGHVDDKGTL